MLHSPPTCFLFWCGILIWDAEGFSAFSVAHVITYFVVSKACYFQVSAIIFVDCFCCHLLIVYIFRFRHDNPLVVEICLCMLKTLRPSDGGGGWWVL